MPYRVNARKKVVEVNGDVDLAVVWRKVLAKGGPEGWTLSTYITSEEFGAILERMGFSHGQEEDDPRVVVKGFRHGEHQVFAENNLLSPLDDDEEDEVL